MRKNFVYVLLLASATTIGWFGPMIYQDQSASGACILNIGCKYHRHYRHPHHYHRHYRHNRRHYR